MKNLTRRYDWATGERISGVTWNTLAHRGVINDCTGCKRSTGSRARVCASFTLAGKVSRTFGIYCTFGSTVWCATNVVRQARACRLCANNATLRVGATRRRNARVSARFQYRFFYKTEKRKMYMQIYRALQNVAFKVREVEIYKIEITLNFGFP